LTTPPLQPTEVGAVELVDRLLTAGWAAGASDIHLVPTERGLDVLLRCNGTLDHHATMDPRMTSKIIGRLKVLADLMVYRTDIPQEGRVPTHRSCVESEVRVSTYPTLLGEKVAVRLDALRAERLSIENLGLPAVTRRALTHAIEQPEGLVLVTGPSGSGKTTTLYSCLHHLVQQPVRRSIVSVEDPIERRIDGVVQTEINDHVGLGYHAALRSILRQDPDVILIGEIRDQRTATIALEAGLTGHLVASTIHAGTAPHAFARLMEMGIEPHTMTSVVRGVVAQRLLRRSCTMQSPDHDDCPVCEGTGYRGRVLISEWISMTRGLREAILARADSSALTAAARATGYRSLRDEAWALVRAGITTMEEVTRVLGSDDDQAEAGVSGPGGGSGVVPSHPGGDVPGGRAAAAGAAPVIPRPAAQPVAAGDAADGPRHRGGVDAGAGVPAAGAGPAVALQGAGEGGDS
jgi:general secretion pathway protein E